MFCRALSGWRSRWERMASGTAYLLCPFLLFYLAAFRAFRHVCFAACLAAWAHPP